MNYNNFKTIVIEIKICILELYQHYMLSWNSKNSSYFDVSINNFRKYMEENYLSEHIEYLNDIPPSFNEKSTNYWESIILKSNRYVPEIEERQRHNIDEKYISLLLPSIETYLNKKYMENISKSTGLSPRSSGSAICRRSDNLKTIIGVLDIMIYAYHLRDNFIAIIDLFNNYNKVNSIDEYESLNIYTNELVKCIDQDIYNVKKLIENIYDEHYIELNNIYKCFKYIIYYFNIIRLTPIINNNNNFIKLIEYTKSIKDIEIINEVINFINITNTIYKLKLDLAKIKNNFEELQNIKTKISDIDDKMDNIKKKLSTYEIYSNNDTIFKLKKINNSF